MSQKQIAVAAGLIAVIVIVLAVTLRSGNKPAPPPAVLAAPVTLILAEPPYTSKTITTAEQMKLSQDPASGWYKMDGKLWSKPHRCYSCGEQIPEVNVPPGTEKPGMFLAQQKCPKCRKPAYEPP